MVSGKVAKILDSYRIVINKGSLDGVHEDQMYVVYEEYDEVPDPENPGTSLGRLELPKIKVKIIHVQDHMAIGISDEYVLSDSPLNAISLIASMGAGQRKRRKLPVDNEAGPAVAAASLKVGDLVRQVYT